jgi:hypothetical protein
MVAGSFVLGAVCWCLQPSFARRFYQGMDLKSEEGNGQAMDLVPSTLLFDDLLVQKG